MFSVGVGVYAKVLVDVGCGVSVGDDVLVGCDVSVGNDSVFGCGESVLFINLVSMGVSVCGTEIAGFAHAPSRKRGNRNGKIFFTLKPQDRLSKLYLRLLGV